MKITITAPRCCNEEDVADELRRIAGMIEEGFTSGEAYGGWWDMSGEFAEQETEDEGE